MTNIADQIIARLNAADSIRNGLSNGDAKRAADNTVTFTFPAPVLSGSCIGSLTIAADGSIFDDTLDNVHSCLDAFIRDLESIMDSRSRMNWIDVPMNPRPRTTNLIRAIGRKAEIERDFLAPGEVAVVKNTKPRGKGDMFIRIGASDERLAELSELLL